MGRKCIKVYWNIFILALSSLCTKEIRSEKSLRIHFNILYPNITGYSDLRGEELTHSSLTTKLPTIVRLPTVIWTSITPITGIANSLAPTTFTNWPTRSKLSIFSSNRSLKNSYEIKDVSAPVSKMQLTGSPASRTSAVGHLPISRSRSSEAQLAVNSL